MIYTKRQAGSLRKNSRYMEHKDNMWLVVRLKTARKEKGKIKEEEQLNCCTDRLEVPLGGRGRGMLWANARVGTGHLW